MRQFVISALLELVWQMIILHFQLKKRVLIDRIKLGRADTMNDIQLKDALMAKNVITKSVLAYVSFSE